MSFQSSLGRQPVQENSLQSLKPRPHIGNWKEESRYSDAERKALNDNPQGHHNLLFVSPAEGPADGQVADFGDSSAQFAGRVEQRSKGARELEAEEEFRRLAQKEEKRVAAAEHSQSGTEARGGRAVQDTHVNERFRDPTGKVPRGKKTFDHNSRHHIIFLDETNDVEERYSTEMSAIGSGEIGRSEILATEPVAKPPGDPSGPAITIYTDRAKSNKFVPGMSAGEGAGADRSFSVPMELPRDFKAHPQ